MASPARDLHSKAMESLARADVARLSGKPRSVKRHLTLSLTLEEQAAYVLRERYDAEPTRSLLFKGAAIIALRLSDWRKAEQMVAYALAGNPPIAVAEELRNLLEDIHFNRHILDSSVKLAEDELDLTVAGNAIGYGIADKDEVFRRVEVLQTIFIRNTERRMQIPFRQRGRPLPVVSREVQLFLATPRAASFGMTIKLGSDQGVLDGMSDVTSMVQNTLLALDAFNSENDSVLRDIIPEEVYRSNFVRQAQELLPDGRRVKAVHLAADSTSRRKVVSLTRKKRATHNADAHREGKVSESKSIYFLTGEILAMDSRAKDEYIAVVSDHGTERVYVPSEAMDTIATYYKDRARVKVRKSGGRLVFEDIDRLFPEGDLD